MTWNFRALSLDLEVGVQGGRIHAFGAIRTDTGERLPYSGSGFAAALRVLDALADGADFLLGHNLIEHDLPWLKATSPDLRLLKLPAVDTLRLSPLAFPSNPYHSLVKHYKDGGLVRSQRNDPLLDSELALKLFREECKALSKADPDLLTAWHWLCTPASQGVDRALSALFGKIRVARRPSVEEAHAAVGARLEGVACATHGHAVFEETSTGWPLAYALAWLSVAGGNSVMPPWVRHQFPEAGRLVRRLRDTPCADPACGWCRERHDAGKELKRWFPKLKGFRPEPEHDGRPMQQAIVEAAMRGEHVLGILPTGTGKSLCYQIPALSRYDKTGALTVVISPLVALMKDQVDGLEARGIGACVTVNGLLSMPERADALDRVRLGDAGILIFAPEQLRSRSVRRALGQREIGAWVMDEAHCLSRWGHDFRPDYLYVARFIGRKAKADGGPVPPVLCLTATAKPDVVDDITRHFRDRLGIELAVFDGGAERSNLDYDVIRTTGGEKFDHIHQVLTSHLPPDAPGGAIVYCATRRRTEEVAEYLQLKDIAADYFHGDRPPETKKDVQQRFIGGDLRAIAATNAFGMGIDKPDVRLVIHADIPGSLENYFQEAGRAGRDRAPAHCVLFYAPDDVERQFGLSARSRLTRQEIHAVLRALRRLDRKKRLDGEVVATAGEILGEDEDKAFERDSATDDTRVRTAIAWLEESDLLKREENFVQIFPSWLNVNSVEQARRKLEDARLEKTYRSQLLRIAEVLIDADADEGVTTDELMAVARLSAEGVRNALFDLERLGISKNETALTAFVHKGVAYSSSRRLEEAAALEEALIAHMREEAPDMGNGDKAPLLLRIAAQVLQDKELADPLPMRLWRIVRSISYDGRGEDGGPGSLSIRKRDAETAQLTLRVSWNALAETAKRRREAARCLLNHLLARLPEGSRGTDLLAETTIGDLNRAIERDLILNGRLKNPVKALERALLWLHEMEIIRLNKGLAVFRPAMTIRLHRREEKRGFAKADFKPLDLHYKEKVLQIHVMAEFARLGLDAIADAWQLAMDYFDLKEAEFLEKWLPGRDKEIGRETTPDSWRAIVENLRNPDQQRIVADEREETNVLVLAGPGSGKTRVLVHRIAWLVRVRRENPRGILALAYNRHAAVDIRRRLTDLIGDDARGITVLTCHGLAMRLAGASFAGRAERPDDDMFRNILRRAVDLLRGKGLLPEEADEQRERLLAGFRWILVDEYQDVGKEEYALISALAGRTLEDETGKLTLFAVGDDDQNIYAFKGASVEFIRRFEADYGPKPAYLTDNYRSTGHIIATANTVIAPAQERMKADRPIRIDRARENDPPGGAWERLDSVSSGKVQILPVGRDPATQAQAVMAELQRLQGMARDRGGDWDWSRCAIIAREWKYLDPVRAFCVAESIPAQMGDEEIPRFWRLRETRAFVKWLRDRRTVDRAALDGWIDSCPPGPWNGLLRQAIEENALETGGADVPAGHVVEWLAEWGRDIRRRQRGLLLSTAHGAKGLEFDHVAVLDGGWDRAGRNEDADAPRRLYYVAMTRARQTLTLARFDNGRNPLLEPLRRHRSVLHRKPAKLPPAPAVLNDRYIRPGLDEIDLGFAGRRDRRDPVHDAIAALSPGDPLETRIAEGDRWLLLDRNGRVVGRLAVNGKFTPPSGMRCRSAEVLAVVGWSRDASEPRYRDTLKSDTWEVLVPELVFEPGE